MAVIQQEVKHRSVHPSLDRTSSVSDMHNVVDRVAHQQSFQIHYVS